MTTQPPCSLTRCLDPTRTPTHSCDGEKRNVESEHKETILLNSFHWTQRQDSVHSCYILNSVQVLSNPPVLDQNIRCSWTAGGLDGLNINVLCSRCFIRLHLDSVVPTDSEFSCSLTTEPELWSPDEQGHKHLHSEAALMKLVHMFCCKLEIINCRTPRLHCSFMKTSN